MLRCARSVRHARGNHCLCFSVAKVLCTMNTRQIARLHHTNGVSPEGPLRKSKGERTIYTFDSRGRLASGRTVRVKMIMQSHLNHPWINSPGLHIGATRNVPAMRTPQTAVRRNGTAIVVNQVLIKRRVEKFNIDSAAHVKKLEKSRRRLNFFRLTLFFEPGAAPM
jgi:hypothetical protein